MNNLKKLFLLAAVSCLGFTAFNVRAASTQAVGEIEESLAVPANSASCWKCDPVAHHLCIGCFDQGTSTSGRTACAPASNPLFFCTLLGTACTITDPCPG